ncbi:hypothetical protein RN001_015851 [Aquatica leii]|uniref:Uncharacterized protein n=1 Tax=Aquatica leii TaxID=1421715 RepID=A0AAN7SAW7_9COLE|nr:hypothetical protein RN001_015851 [Aquatica leii]
MRPGEFSCVQLRICMLDEILNPKKHFFLCEDCRILVLPCTASLKILAVSRAVSELETKKGCFLCGSTRCIKQFNITDQDINDRILFRFTQEYTYMTETKDKICKSCNEMYTDLQELYKQLLYIIKPKKIEVSVENNTPITYNDTGKKVVKDLKKNTKSNTNGNIENKNYSINSQEDSEELNTTCNKPIETKVHTTIRNNACRTKSSCNIKENQNVENTVVETRVKTKSNVSKNTNNMESEYKSSSPLPAPAHVTDKYHSSKTKYPRKLPSLAKTNDLEEQPEPIIKRVRFKLNIEEHIPANENLYAKREKASNKPLRSCLKKSSIHLQNQITNDVETTCIKKQSQEAWEENSNCSSSSIIDSNFKTPATSINNSNSFDHEYDNCKNVSNTIQPHFRDNAEEDDNSLSNDSDASQYLNQDLGYQSEQNFKDGSISECDTNSDEEIISNASSNSDNEHTAKSTDSNFTDEDELFPDPIDEEEMLRKQQLLNESLKTKSIHQVSKLLKSMNRNLEVPSQHVDLKTYFTDTDGNTTSDTMSVTEDNNEIVHELQKDADTLLYRRRRSCCDDTDDVCSDTDTSQQTKSRINYNLTSTFQVNSIEPLFILTSFKDKEMDKYIYNLLKVKRLQKYKPKPKAYQFPSRSEPKPDIKKKKHLEESMLLASSSLWLDSNESFIELAEFKEREAEMIKRSAGISYPDKNKDTTLRTNYKPKSSLTRFDGLKPAISVPKKLFLKSDKNVTPETAASNLTKETSSDDDEDFLEGMLEANKQRICKHAMNLARNFADTTFRSRIKNAERLKNTKKIIVGDREIYLNMSAFRNKGSDSNEDDITVIYQPKSSVTDCKYKFTVTNTVSREQETPKRTNPKTVTYKMSSTKYNSKYIPKTKQNETYDSPCAYFEKNDISIEEMFERCTKKSRSGSYNRNGDSDDSENF